MEKLKRKLPQFLLKLFLTALCVTMLLPFAWIFSTSLRTASESYGLPPAFFPTAFNIQNYIDVFEFFPFARFIWNSVKVAFIVVILNTLVTTSAAYAFARIPFKGREQIFLLFLAGVMIPGQATMIPVFIIMSKLQLVGTLWSLVWPAVISPISIFFVRQFMKTIPNSYEEAAYIDGASRFRIYAQIFVPMSKSVIIMTSLLCFLASWNNFMGPLIYLSKWESMTLPIGLSMLNNANGTTSISVIFAGIITSLVVPTVLYIVGQKYILQGSTLSGLKS